MDPLQISNDARGWLMSLVSGIACVVGASIICVDTLVRYIPSKRNFRIQDSGVFLACSLSLSFGVMLFSALVSMLPSSKDYLSKGGFSHSAAEWTRLGCFMAGFIGIQVISRLLHRYIPSHTVDCDHTNRGTPAEGHTNDHGHTHSHSTHKHSVKPRADLNCKANEATPLLLDGENGHADGAPPKPFRQPSFRTDARFTSRRHSSSTGRRPSMTQVQSRVMSFVKDTKSNCDEGGPCYGYSDPCGQECFKCIHVKSPWGSSRPTLPRGTATSTTNNQVHNVPEIRQEDDLGNQFDSTAATISSRTSRAQSWEPIDRACESDEEDLEAQHHHHVPTNAFMNIGLQTSIAIALHKLPEGFITYATNHANPSLGFTVFMALFLHNVTEGFAMALPLSLALGSRFQAMFWSSLLGGFSQPFGAAIAAIWFKLAKSTDHAPGFAVYGCMFAITAGIMASVALALFIEGLSINHNTQLCIASALMGMSILGVSTALTA